jgi:nucleotidyltransferase substrate binding protein (TIGR01987 family)
MEQDIRWKQRFQNFSDVFKQLEFAVKKISDSSDLEKEGTIQRFEFTHELAWKVMKDYLEYEGIHGITGSRSASREAFNKGLISNGQIWMDIDDLNTPYLVDLSVYSSIKSESLKDHIERIGKTFYKA